MEGRNIPHPVIHVFKWSAHGKVAEYEMTNSTTGQTAAAKTLPLKKLLVA
jgi:hypothetical protein